MSKEVNEWELDWWWLEVLEGEVSAEEKKEAEWLLEKSTTCHQRYESWRSLRREVLRTDWAAKVQWDSSYFESLREGIMARIESEYPANHTRP